MSLRTADLINWHACAQMFSHLDFSLRSPVLMAALTAPGWKLDLQLPEAFTVTVETYHGLPVLALRYQWGTTQAVFLADAAEEGLWSCLKLWQDEGRAQLQLCELDGHAAQRPPAVAVPEAVRDAAAPAKGIEVRVLLATLGAAIQYGQVARTSQSLIPGIELGELDIFVIRSQKMLEITSQVMPTAVDSGPTAHSLH